MPYQIIKRYSKSLFEVAVEGKKLEIVYRDLIQIKDTINAHDELLSVLENPSIPHTKRKEILEEIFKAKIGKATFSFLIFLDLKGRLNYLNGIISYFEKMYLKHNKTIDAKITSAIPLNDKQIKEICTHFKTKLNINLIPQCVVDPSIIGGITIQVEDQIYDYSLITELNTFKRQCIHS